MQNVKLVYSWCIFPFLFERLLRVRSWHRDRMWSLWKAIEPFGGRGPTTWCCQLLTVIFQLQRIRLNDAANIPFYVSPMLATRCSRALRGRVKCLAVRATASRLLPSTCDSWSLDAQISHQCFLRKLEVIRSKLREHLGQQEWPRLTHVNVGGVSLKLPLRANVVLEKHVLLVHADLAYLGGFFDGDGCVSSNSHLSSCSLLVGQTASNVRVLIAFLCRFGGCISVLSSGKGVARPTLQWQICGNAARSAASELHEHCLVKMEQLRIAITWPEPKETRIKCNLKLKALKKNKPTIARKVASWQYFTGFFDAEGCITISATSRSICLEVSQRELPILSIMRDFLLSRLAAESNVFLRQSQFGHVMRVSSKKEVTYILEEMLANGLLIKRPTAEHVVGSIDASHDWMRGAEPDVKGNQNVLRKLDGAGCLRASNIHRLQVKSRNAKTRGQMLAVAELNDQLADAKLEHGILNAMTQIKRLRSAIATLRSQPSLWHEVRGMHVTAQVGNLLWAINRPPQILHLFVLGFLLRKLPEKERQEFWASGDGHGNTLVADVEVEWNGLSRTCSKYDSLARTSCSWIQLVQYSCCGPWSVKINHLPLIGHSNGTNWTCQGRGIYRCSLVVLRRGRDGQGWESFGHQSWHSSWQVWRSDLLGRSRQWRPSILSRMGTLCCCLVGCRVAAALNLSLASDATLSELKNLEG